MSDSFKDLYEIRDMQVGDENFVMATFLRGIYYGNEFFSLIPKKIFMDNYKHVAKALADNRAKTVVKVASLKDDSSIIIGYSILSADYQTIHWVYVKDKFRKQGIGRSLVPQYPAAFSHFTTLGKSLLTKFEGIIFNPFL